MARAWQKVKMKDCRRIAVRDCQAFLWQMYSHYNGEAHASFEGKISVLEFDEIPGATCRETSCLKPIDEIGERRVGKECPV